MFQTQHFECNALVEKKIHCSYLSLAIVWSSEQRICLQMIFDLFFFKATS